MDDSDDDDGDQPHSATRVNSTWMTVMIMTVTKMRMTVMITKMPNLALSNKSVSL